MHLASSAQRTLCNKRSRGLNRQILLMRDFPAKLAAIAIGPRSIALFALAAAKARGVNLGNPNGAGPLHGKQTANAEAVAKIRQKAVRRAQRWRRGMSLHLAHRGHGRESRCKDKSGGQCRQCDAKTHDIASKNKTRNAYTESGGLHRERRDLAVEPILLVGQGRPCLRHAQVALESWFAFGTLRKLQAVLGVSPEYV
jgi:hypothetical protein